MAERTAKNAWIDKAWIDREFPVRQRKPVPHQFVLDALAEAQPRTNPMFGCLAVYVGEKIVLILRDNRDPAADNGVWLATTRDYHESLRDDFPNMRSIQVLGEKVTSWQVLPVDTPDFEESALHACELILAGDPRIGRVPGVKKKKRRSRIENNGSDQTQSGTKFWALAGQRAVLFRNPHERFFERVPSEFKLPSAVMREALQTSLATLRAVSRRGAPSAMIELAASVN